MSLNFGGINIGGTSGGGGGGTSNHAQLTNLDFTNSGHTGFLDYNASNITNIGKSFVSEFLAVSSEYITLTPDSFQDIEVPATGWVSVIAETPNANSSYCGLYRGGVPFAGGWVNNNAGARYTYAMPLSKGEKFSIGLVNYSTSNITINFFYAEGTKHEKPTE